MQNFFANSDDFLMLYYPIFGTEKDCWALINKKDQSVIVSEKLVNDIDGIQISNNNLFYVNDSTWYGMLYQEENNCNIGFQVLHLKR